MYSKVDLIHAGYFYPTDLQRQDGKITPSFCFSLHCVCVFLLFVFSFQTLQATPNRGRVACFLHIFEDTKKWTVLHWLASSSQASKLLTVLIDLQSFLLISQKFALFMLRIFPPNPTTLLLLCSCWENDLGSCFGACVCVSTCLLQLQ